MTDKDRFFTATAGARHFHMHFCHQRAGRVEDRQIAAFRFVAHRLGNAMRRENQDRAVRHFAYLLDKNRAALAQAVYHIAVMHHFMTHINRRAVQGQRVFDNADCTVNASTKPTRVSQQDLHSTSPVPDQPPARRYQNEGSARQVDG